MKKIVFSLVTMMMLSTSVSFAKTSKETTNETLREEQMELPRSKKIAKADKKKMHREETYYKQEEVKPKDAPFKKSEITISMQTLHF